MIRTVPKTATETLKSKEHLLRLKDGRILAYHTFPEAETKDQQKNLHHPVLYFHGFPGCGLEASSVCARSVAREGGRIYAIDRPGMGKASSPYGSKSVRANVAESMGNADTINEDDDDNGDNNNNNYTDINSADANLDTFVDSVWELVENRGWEEFSVIGVSGGGPYTLALLASYLRRRECPSKTSLTTRLRNVCLVGAVCVSAGTDGMKEELVQMATVVEKTQSSWWNRFKLRAMTVSVGPIYNYLIPAMPISLTMYLNSYGLQDSPPADREWMSDEGNIRPFLLATQSMVAQGGYPGAYDDATILFRADQPHEEVLRKKYGCTSGDGSGNETQDDLPAVGIFQGGLDVNVPPSHAKYMHESLFHRRSRYFEYEDLGHVSTVAGKSDVYAVFATAARNK